MELNEALNHLPGLRALPASAFEAFSDAMMVRPYSDGHVFIQEGGRANDLFLLLEGQVRVTRKRGRDSVPVIEPGAMFGLVALVDSLPRSASCVGVGRTRVASIPINVALLLFSTHAPLALALQEALATQLAADYRRCYDRLGQAARPGV